jgi:hypothetical protein
MFKFDDFDYLDLTLTNGKITSFIDVLTSASLNSFHQRLTRVKVAKLYVLKENDTYLYVGTTLQSLTSRFRYGLAADGKNGYHGYKWKDKERVRLYVWCFEELNKIEIESIEAELVFLIRHKTGLWPLRQNEIHFNNEYAEGRNIAAKLYRWIE